MADEKPTKGSKRYGSAPSIKPATRKGDTVEDGTPDKVNATAESNVAEATMNDPGPEGTEAAGTESVDVNGMQSDERKAMMDRHETEMKDMHKRHLKEMKDLMARHGKAAA